MRALPAAARKILNDGTLCYLAAPSAAGPHATPVVFVLDGGRIWGTTGRSTTKAKLWRRDPTAGGLVGEGGSWLTFRGPLTLYDALDPRTWPASVLRGPRVASASIRFSMKNARFFAGYARDVTRVPLAWTPPGRVIFSIDPASGALLEKGEVAEKWGTWTEGDLPAGAFRATRTERSFEGLPDDVKALLGQPGDGTVALSGDDGPLVLPARWSLSAGSFFAVVPASILSLAGGPNAENASLVVDRASAWRAAKMKGVLIRGPASIYHLSEMRRGASDLRERLGDIPDGSAVVRIRPKRAVWWSGWASGTVRPS